MITDNEKFIEVQGILTLSDISPNNCVKINNLIIELSKENQELKKQLEEYQLQNINLREDIMVRKIAFPNKLIKDKTFYNLYDMFFYEELLVQQKAFIKYLEDEIKQINPKILDDGELNLRLDDVKYTQYLIYKEVLQKYRSIIGGNDV